MASAMEVAKEIIAINDRLLDEWAERPGYAQMTGCTDDSASLAGARKIDEKNAEKEWSDTRSAIYSRAAALITAYAKQVGQQKWISVKERLPPLGVPFDAWDSYHQERVANHGPFTGAWDDDFRRSVLLVRGFTHWMPLPEPPQIESEEAE